MWFNMRSNLLRSFHADMYKKIFIATVLLLTTRLCLSLHEAKSVQIRGR